MRRSALGALAAAALMALGSPLPAQTLGVGLGPTFSLDGDGVDFHIMATLRLNREVGNPVGFRVDGMVQFTGSDNLFIGTANAVYNFVSSPESRIRPYVIGGPGLYADGGTDFGINAGAGASFPLGFGDSPARAFAEARYHAIFAEGTTVEQLPITAGIIFLVGR
jgi:hypothetical protein